MFCDIVARAPASSSTSSTRLLYARSRDEEGEEKTYYTQLTFMLAEFREKQGLPSEHYDNIVPLARFAQATTSARITSFLGIPRPHC